MSTQGSQITWQNVQAPEFGSSIDGLRSFSALLGNAFDSAGQGVRNFDRTNSNITNNQVALGLAGISDADAAKQAIQNGVVGGIDLHNPDVLRRLDPATISAIQARPGQLINLASDQLKLSNDQRDTSQRAAMDSQSSTLAAAEAARQAGHTDEANSLLGKIDWSKTGYKNADDYITNGQGIDRSFLSNQRSGFDNKVAIQDRDIDTMARNFVEQIRPVNGTPQEQQHLLRQALAGHENDPLYGRVSQRAYELLGAAAGGGGGSGGIGGGGGFPALGGGTGDMSTALGLVTGGKQLPDSIQTLGDFTNDANRSAILGLGGGHSSSGLFQTTIDTVKQFGQKALGSDWQKANFRDPTVQDKLGKAVFDDALSQKDPAQALMGRWAALTAQQAQQLAASKDWTQARQVIAAGESSSDPAAILANAAVGAGASVVERSRQDPTGLSAAMIAKAGVQRDPAQVAGELATKYKMTEADATAAIQHIIDLGHNMRTKDNPGGIDINPDQAVEIFNRSRTQEGIGDWVGGWAFGSNNRAGEKMRTRDSAINENIRKYASPQALQQVVRDTERSRLEGVNSSNLQGFQAAYQNYTRAVTEARNNPAYAKSGLVERAKQQMLQSGQMAGVSSARLQQFVDPRYFGDTSLIKGVQQDLSQQVQAALNKATGGPPDHHRSTPVVAVQPGRAPGTGTGSGFPSYNGPAVRPGETLGLIDGFRQGHAAGRAKAAARNAQIDALSAQRDQAAKAHDSRAVSMIDAKINALL